MRRRAISPDNPGLGSPRLGSRLAHGCFSLLAGNRYGRVIGIAAGSVGAIGALLSIGSGNPWWSLAILALCVYVVHGIVTFGQDERALAT